jgi:hypothetical protein
VAVDGRYEAECVRVRVHDPRHSTFAAISFVGYGRHCWIALPRTQRAFDRDLLAAVVSLFYDAAAAVDPRARVVAVIPVARSVHYAASLLKRPEYVRYGCLLDYARPVRPMGTFAPCSLGVVDDSTDPLWNALQDDDKRRTWAFAASGFRAVAKRRAAELPVLQPLLDVLWYFPGGEFMRRDAARAFEIAWRWNDRVPGVLAVLGRSACAATHAILLLQHRTAPSQM